MARTWIDQTTDEVIKEAYGRGYRAGFSQGHKNGKATARDERTREDVCEPITHAKRLRREATIARYYLHYRGSVARADGPSLPDER